MTEHIQAFFASKKTQTISLLLGLLSLILTLACFLAPLSRERWAIQSLGETTAQQLSPLSMSMAHYEPQRLRYLLATETTGPTYDKLIDLLSQAKKEYGFSRLYLVMRKRTAVWPAWLTQIMKKTAISFRECPISRTSLMKPAFSK